MLRAAATPYLRAGPGLFAYFFARGKLGGDPVYRALLENGWLSGRARILDLGCGQGLLTAWLRAARRVEAEGAWPEGWPAPPRPESIRGIELLPREVRRARRALGPDAGIEVGDIRDADFGTPDAAVMFDVLHYLPADAQRDVLQRLHAALPPGGRLLLRVGDAGAGLRFRYTRGVDAVIMSLRGHARVTTCCRSVAQWCTLLAEIGFETEARPMSHGTPFANVLLLASARRRCRPAPDHPPG